MSLSSNAIIHLTQNLETIKSILKEGFRVKYCKETIRSKKKKINLYAPMVSFCDIPLSEIKDHITRYGEYGIGMKKRWAETMRLNPVLYVDKESILLENLLDGLSELVGDDKISDMETDSVKSKISDIYRYIKNYEADLFRKGRLAQRNYRFSDEREWRYVPMIGVIFHHTYDGPSL